MIYNKKLAAKTLNVSTITLDRLRREGKMPYHKVGSRRIIFTSEDLEIFLDSCAIPAVNPATIREKRNMANRVLENENENSGNNFKKI